MVTLNGAVQNNKVRKRIQVYTVQDISTCKISNRGPQPLLKDLRKLMIILNGAVQVYTVQDKSTYKVSNMRSQAVPSTRLLQFRMVKYRRVRYVRVQVYTRVHARFLT